MCPKSGLGVNVNLLPVKVTYFLLFAAIAVLLPYLPIYMKQLGLSPAESAIILSVTTAVTGVIRACVGIIADKLKRHRLIIFICCLIGGVFHFGILFVPPTASDPSSEMLEWKVCCRSASLVPCDSGVSNGSVYDSSHLSVQSLIVDVSMRDAMTVNHPRICELRCCSNFQGSFPAGELNNSTIESQRNSCVLVTDLMVPALETVANCSDGCDSDLRVEFETKKFCPLANRGACFIVCGNDSTSSVHSDHSVPRYQETFVLVFILFFIGQSAFSPIFNLLDGLVYVYLGDKHGEFGKQRLWGTVAFGLFALTTGFIMVALAKYTTRNPYLYSFIAFLCLLLLTGCTVYFYKKTPESPSGDGIMKDIRFLLCDFYLVIIYIVMFVAGMFSGVLEAFFFWFLTDLHAEQSLFGVSLLVSCILETTVLFFSGSLIKKLGFGPCIYVVFAVFTLRLLANSFIVNPWVAIATEATQCVCFGLLYPTMTSWGSTLTPPGMHGTVQGIMGAMYLSIGRATGAALGGVFFEAYGPRTMFRIFAVFSFVFLLALVLVLEAAKSRLRKASAPTVVAVEEIDKVESHESIKEDGRKMIRDETVQELLDPPTANHSQDKSKGSEKEMESLVANGT